MDTPDAPPPPEGRRARLRRLARRPWPWLAVGSFALAGGAVHHQRPGRPGRRPAGRERDRPRAPLVRGQRADTDALQTPGGRAEHRGQRALARRRRPDRQPAAAHRSTTLRGPAGLSPVSGPGVTVTLQDAPQDVLDRAIQDGEPPGDTLVVHQQDIQAVVNALWLGGAERDHDHGPADHLHHRHQVRRPDGDPARRAVLPAVPDQGGRRPDRACWRRWTARTTSTPTAPWPTPTASATRSPAPANLDLPGYEGTLELRYAKPLTGG